MPESLFLRFPLERGRRLDVWTSTPITDDATRHLLVVALLETLDLYKRQLARAEEFEAAGAMENMLRPLGIAAEPETAKP